MSFWDEFLGSNEWQWRLARTVVEGVLGVVVANIDLLLGYVVLDASARAFLVALVMAVLTPVLSLLGAGDGGDGGDGGEDGEAAVEAAASEEGGAA